MLPVNGVGSGAGKRPPLRRSNSESNLNVQLPVNTSSASAPSSPLSRLSPVSAPRPSQRRGPRVSTVGRASVRSSRPRSQGSSRRAGSHPVRRSSSAAGGGGALTASASPSNSLIAPQVALSPAPVPPSGGLLPSGAGVSPPAAASAALPPASSPASASPGILFMQGERAPDPNGIAPGTDYYPKAADKLAIDTAIFNDLRKPLVSEETRFSRSRDWVFFRNTRAAFDLILRGGSAALSYFKGVSSTNPVDAAESLWTLKQESSDLWNEMRAYRQRKKAAKEYLKAGDPLMRGLAQFAIRENSLKAVFFRRLQKIVGAGGLTAGSLAGILVLAKVISLAAASTIMWPVTVGIVGLGLGIFVYQLVLYTRRKVKQMQLMQLYRELNSGDPQSLAQVRSTKLYKKLLHQAQKGGDIPPPPNSPENQDRGVIRVLLIKMIKYRPSLALTLMIDRLRTDNRDKIEAIRQGAEPEGAMAEFLTQVYGIDRKEFASYVFLQSSVSREEKKQLRAQLAAVKMA